MRTLTQKQARSFLLRKHGLTGPWRFFGKQGVLDFVRQTGAVQFDPVDVCGRNADLVLLARVKGYRKEMLDALLYRDRLLIDYFDKCLNILPVETWPHLERRRAAYRARTRSMEQIEAVAPVILEALRGRESLCARELDLPGTVDWYWSDTSLARAALEALYFRGDLIVHHKSGTQKHYALAERHIPTHLLQAGDPHPADEDHDAWTLLRRIGAVGLMWNKASDAWLDSAVHRAGPRTAAFERLTRQGLLIPVQVEGIREPLHLCARDEPLLEQSLGTKAAASRAALLGPLDSLLWDRRLIQALFGFDYKWEIYTPAEKRKYGHYVVPVLYGDRFVGRAEALRDSAGKALVVRNLWLEPGAPKGEGLRRAMASMFERLAVLNGCPDLRYEQPL